MPTPYSSMQDNYPRRISTRVLREQIEEVEKSVREKEDAAQETDDPSSGTINLLEQHLSNAEGIFEQCQRVVEEIAGPPLVDKEGAFSHTLVGRMAKLEFRLYKLHSKLTYIARELTSEEVR